MYYVFLAALTTTECCQRTMPISFSPTSVQFKGEINDALPCKRHQKRHLDFCTAYLRSRGSGVRVSPGAPLSPSLSSSYKPLLDRKSTRLNSSHVEISYAVFCLKKKRTATNTVASVCHLDGTSNEIDRSE